VHELTQNWGVRRKKGGGKTVPNSYQVGNSKGRGIHRKGKPLTCSKKLPYIGEIEGRVLGAEKKNCNLMLNREVLNNNRVREMCVMKVLGKDMSGL